MQPNTSKKSGKIRSRTGQADEDRRDLYVGLFIAEVLPYASTKFIEKLTWDCARRLGLPLMCTLKRYRFRQRILRDRQRKLRDRA